MTGLDQSVQKLRADGASDLAIAKFERFWRQVSHNYTGLVPEESIEPLGEVGQLDEARPEEDAQALARTAFLKLNGGLGTSMGLDRAKSMLPVRGDLRFIDIIVKQVEHVRAVTGVDVPLLFMNSFRTSADTLEALPENFNGDLPVELLQGREPKIYAHTLAPVEYSEDPELEWCPPGHGDIYTAMYDSGLLHRLLDAGFKYLNTANADNLGAYPDARIAGWFARSGADYSPEVCLRTLADVKGGHLARRKSDGKVVLRDTAQTPEEDMHFFTDLYRHRFFHTNNLWFNLESLVNLLEKNSGMVKLPLIRNEKTLDPRDSSTPRVIQIESAIGSIVELFDSAIPLEVPRTRFQPVKTTNDLLPLRSDAYSFGDDGRLQLRADQAPHVELDPQHYKLVDDFDQRFAVVPSLLECTSLTIRGDWSFNGPAVLRGEVRLDGSGTIGA